MGFRIGECHFFLLYINVAKIGVCGDSSNGHLAKRKVNLPFMTYVYLFLFLAFQVFLDKFKSR